MNREAAETVLAQHPLLRGASHPRLRRLAAVAVGRRVSAGQLLCGVAERTGCVWFVGRGLLHATTQSRRGSPVTVDVLRPGEAFGYLNCWMSEPHTEDVSGLVAAEVVGVPASHFMEYVRAHQSAAQLLLVETAERMRSLMRLRAISTEPASARVRSVLAFLHDKIGPKIPMTREMIAMVAGLTMETVSRSMAPLRRRGVIEVSRGVVEILDAESLS